jgi:predicted Zn-dependent protease
MENTFPGVFTNGTTLQRSRVDIKPDSTGLHLTGPEMQVFWAHSAIRRSRVDLPDELVLKSGNAFHPDVLNIQPATDFISVVKKVAPAAAYLPGKMSTLTKALLLAAFLILLTIIGLIAGASWLLPKLAGFAARKVPYSVEQKISKPMLAALLKGEEIDTARTRSLNGFYRQMEVKHPYPVHLTVVSKPVINAFAIPGGEIVVYSGLLDRLDTPHMLVALLGHETGHVAGRHSLISLIRELAAKGLLLVILNDVNGLAAILLSRADMLQQLAYTRQLELAADRFSLTTLQRLGFSPDALVRLLEMLQKSASTSAEAPEFLSTHPAPKTRISEIKKLIRKLPNMLDQRSRRDSLQIYWKQLQKQTATSY